MPVKKRKEFLDSHRVKYVSIVHSRAYTAQEIALGPRSGQRAGEGRHFEHPIVKVDGRIAMAVRYWKRKHKLERTG